MGVPSPNLVPRRGVVLSSLLREARARGALLKDRTMLEVGKSPLPTPGRRSTLRGAAVCLARFTNSMEFALSHSFCPVEDPWKIGPVSYPPSPSLPPMPHDP